MTAALRPLRSRAAGVAHLAAVRLGVVGLGLVGLGLVGLGVVACTPLPSGVATSTPRVTTTATASEEPVPAPSATVPALALDGTAEDNLAYFAGIVAAVWASEDRASGRAYVDALASGGFDRAAMQVTRDESTVGNPAESIQFSVLWDDACLVGQVGPATGDPVTVVLPAIAGGSCLVGPTRPIDW